jgi:hypothetical protein
MAEFPTDKALSTECVTRRSNKTLAHVDEDTEVGRTLLLPVFKFLAVGAARCVRRLLPAQKAKARVSSEYGVAPRETIWNDIASTGTGAIAGLRVVSTTAASAVYWSSSLAAHAVAFGRARFHPLLIISVFA